LLDAVRGAGLRPEGIDLSAFALIRSLHRSDEEHGGRVLYLNVGGLTNMAIAEGTVCRFTRVISGGLESMAIEVAERNGVKLSEARELLAAVDLDQGSATAFGSTPTYQSFVGQSDGIDAQFEVDAQSESFDGQSEGLVGQREGFEDQPEAFDSQAEPAPTEQPRIDVRPILSAGVREIAGEVRNSLDFHRSQEGGGEVSSVVVSGPALQIKGFSQALQNELRVPLKPQIVGLFEQANVGDIAPERLAVATGLAVEEAPR